MPSKPPISATKKAGYVPLWCMVGAYSEGKLAGLRQALRLAGKWKSSPPVHLPGVAWLAERIEAAIRREQRRRAK